MRSSSKAKNLDQIRDLIHALPDQNYASVAQCQRREAALVKPTSALGRLEELSSWLAGWQGRHPPQCRNPRTVVFAGNHGVARHGVSGYPSNVTAQMVQSFLIGGGAVNQLCRAFGSKLSVYGMQLDQPTRDFLTDGPAMTQQECAEAIAFGMSVVDRRTDVLALGEMGIGNSTSAAALCYGMFGGSALEWTTIGTLKSAQIFYDRKVPAVEQARRLHAENCVDGLDWLAAVGGRELAAIVGAIIGARQRSVPVILDGYVCTAAAAALWSINSESLDHCRVALSTSDLSHVTLCEKLNQRPLLDLDIQFGEGSGSTLAMGLLKAAVACHVGMTGFAEANVDREQPLGISFLKNTRSRRSAVRSMA